MSLLASAPVRSAVRVVLFAVDAFVTVVGAVGATAVALRLTGPVLPFDLLGHAPSGGSVGLALALAACLTAAVASLATLRGPRAGGLTSLLAGVVLLSLVLAQPGATSGTSMVYLTSALTMMALGALALLTPRVPQPR